MIEVHGWITLRYSDYHSEEARQDAFTDSFKTAAHRICGTDLWNECCRFTRRNGLDCFTIDVQHNHKGEPFYPLEIFEWAAKESTGSYGLLYFHDDEDPDFHNEFQVYVLKRGKLTKAQDQFLSPYEEEVERGYDENDPPLD